MRAHLRLKRNIYMKVQVRKIEEKEQEQIIIECVDLTREVEEIRAFALSKGTTLTGLLEERVHLFPLSAVYYFEAVDERVFAYTKTHAYEMKVRLYQLEELYQNQHFIRCGKSFVINLLKLGSISPALNGRFTAHMKNGEKIMVSRQYVPALKKAVLGGAC